METEPSDSAGNGPKSKQGDEEISKEKQQKTPDDHNKEGEVTEVSHEAEKENGAKSSEEPGSPDANCSICLGKLENKSFTDSCFHTFCFVCLMEWSKVKAVCPLCKQPFKSIIHNVRSYEDYDKYDLRTENASQVDAENDARFRYRTTLTSQRWQTRQRREHERQLEMLQRPTRTTAGSLWHRQRQAATSSFRKRVYSTGMRVTEVRTACGRPMRYREINPAFFTRNPACTHRLVPWLNREINVLLHNHNDNVQFLLELIMDLIKRFDIQSEEFAEHIRSFLGRNTEHFIHELFMFARSPYDLVAYDDHAVYDVTNNNHELHEISSSSEDSVEAMDLSLDYRDFNHRASNINRLSNDGVIILNSDDSDDEDIIAIEGPNFQDSQYRGSISPVPSLLPSYQYPHHAHRPITQSMDIVSHSPLINRVHNFLHYAMPLDTRHTTWDDPPLEFIPIDHHISSMSSFPSTSAVVYIAHEDQPSTSKSNPIDLSQPSTSSNGVNPNSETPTRVANFDTLAPVQADGPNDQNDQSDDNMPNKSRADSTADAKGEEDPPSSVRIKRESVSSWENGSDIVIVGYDKPWEERSPVPVSSAGEQEIEDITEESLKKKKKVENKKKTGSKRTSSSSSTSSRSTRRRSSSSSSSSSSSLRSLMSRRRKRTRRSRSRHRRSRSKSYSHRRRRRSRTETPSAFSDHRRKRRRRSMSNSRRRSGSKTRRPHHDRSRERHRRDSRSRSRLQRHSRSPSRLSRSSRTKKSNHPKKRSRSISPLVYERSKPSSRSRNKRSRSHSKGHHRGKRALSSSSSSQEFTALGKYNIPDKPTKKRNQENETEKRASKKQLRKEPSPSYLSEWVESRSKRREGSAERRSRKEQQKKVPDSYAEYEKELRLEKSVTRKTKSSYAEEWMEEQRRKEKSPQKKSKSRSNVEEWVEAVGPKGRTRENSVESVCSVNSKTRKVQKSKHSSGLTNRRSSIEVVYESSNYNKDRTKVTEESHKHKRHKVNRDKKRDQEDHPRKNNTVESSRSKDDYSRSRDKQSRLKDKESSRQYEYSSKSMSNSEGLRGSGSTNHRLVNGSEKDSPSKQSFKKHPTGHKKSSR